MTKTKSQIVLGTCPVCKEIVKTRDTFDMVAEKWGADFLGDTAKTVTRFLHRDCNHNANHTKDK